MARKPTRISQPFKPRARLLQILGDQLIGSSRLAVFELVKNAYDADASKVTVRIDNINTKTATIVVEDNGTGMSVNDIIDIWLVPADDHRERQRESNVRTSKFNRLPLGEKGVGRFAVHKLGNKVKLITRAPRHRECVVALDWSGLMENKFLDEAVVAVTEQDPTHFTSTKRGTRIEISQLRETSWTRRDVRELWRQVTSIASPFGRKSDRFEVKLEVPDEAWWLSDLPDIRDLLARAPWHFKFQFDGRKIVYTYSFHGVPGVKVQKRVITRSEPLQVVRELEPDDLDPANGPKRRRREKVIADNASIRGIGPMSGEFYIFDRDREIISKYGESRLIERFLDQSGGIRVYRDNIRVYNYGERDDDWLSLDIRRVNSPTRNISRNIVVGAIDISLEKSKQLREKTNREGFVENSAFTRFKELVLGALSKLEAERQVDKAKLRIAVGKPSSGPRGITEPIARIRRLAKKHGVIEPLEPSIRRIEEDYNTLRETFLRAGLSNVGLAIVFHEVERGVSVLHRSIEAGASYDRIRLQSGQLQSVLENSTRLLRKSDRSRQSLRDLVIAARDISLVRFQMHEVKLVCPSLEEVGPDADALYSFNLALGAITNIIDNAIYWLQVARPEGAAGAGARRLYMSVVRDWPGGPAIVIADNGTGFSDDPQQLVEPFFSRKPDGIGMGLYYASIVMQLNDGRMEFPDANDLDLPPGFDGAVIALVFKGA
ncbi:MAG TPA: ATP-binding protein [Allosphingosinicella sp.]|nr:ATP-binding protein [Allosphingosinicella sp.]